MSLIHLLRWLECSKNHRLGSLTYKCINVFEGVHLADIDLGSVGLETTGHPDMVESQEPTAREGHIHPCWLAADWVVCTLISGFLSLPGIDMLPGDNDIPKQRSHFTALRLIHSP